jgi:hypothetical protein
MFRSKRGHHQGTKPKQDRKKQISQFYTPVCIKLANLVSIKVSNMVFCNIALVWFPDDDLLWMETCGNIQRQIIV